MCIIVQLFKNRRQYYVVAKFHKVGVRPRIDPNFAAVNSIILLIK